MAEPGKDFLKFGLRLTALLLGSIIVSGWLVNYYDPPPPDDSMYLLPKKYELLRTTPGKRIVLVGGSSTLVGVDSDKLHQQFGLPVVNYGFAAPLGVDFYLKDTLGGIHSGDTVILMLEYGLYYRETGDDYQLARVIEVYPRALGLLMEEPLDRYSTWFKLLFQIKYLRHRDPRLVPASPKANINQWGDYLNLLNVSLGQEIELQPLVKKGLPSERVTNKINLYIKEVEERGAKILIMFPPTMENELNCFECFDQIKNYLIQNMRCPVVGIPQNYIFPRELMSDSLYHLNGEGRRIRTERMIVDLLKAGIFISP